MSRRDRAVADVCRADALLARQHAIDEILCVAGRDVRLPLAAIEVRLKPARVRRFQLAAVDEQPASVPMNFVPSVCLLETSTITFPGYSERIV